MTRKAIIRLGVIGDGEKTVALSKDAILSIIDAVLLECESIEREIQASSCVNEKSRLMKDYQSLTESYKSLDSIGDCL